MGHLFGRGAGVQDDRIAVMNQLGRGLAKFLLGGQMPVIAFLHRQLAGQPGAGQRPAAAAHQQPVFIQFIQVGADRDGRNRKLPGQGIHHDLAQTLRLLHDLLASLKGAQHNDWSGYYRKL